MESLLLVLVLEVRVVTLEKTSGVEERYLMTTGNVLGYTVTILAKAKVRLSRPVVLYCLEVARAITSRSTGRACRAMVKAWSGWMM